jgi:hypothetical protein
MTLNEAESPQAAPAEVPAENGCCATVAQEECCAPSDKATCCTPEKSARGSCGCK